MGTSVSACYMFRHRPRHTSMNSPLLRVWPRLTRARQAHASELHRQLPIPGALVFHGDISGRMLMRNTRKNVSKVLAQRCFAQRLLQGEAVPLMDEAVAVWASLLSRPVYDSGAYLGNQLHEWQALVPCDSDTPASLLALLEFMVAFSVCLCVCGGRTAQTLRSFLPDQSWTPPPTPTDPLVVAARCFFQTTCGIDGNSARLVLDAAGRVCAVAAV